MDINYLAEAINNNKEFSDLLRKATLNLFESIPDVLFSNRYRKIKIYRLDSQNIIYILDKCNDMFNVYVKDIFTYGHKPPTMQCLYPYLQCLKLAPSKELFCYKLLNFQHSAINTSTHSFFGKLKSFCSTQSKEAGVLFDGNLDKSFMSERQCHLTITSNIGKLAEYIELLNSTNFLAHPYSLSFFKSLSSKFNPIVQSSLVDFKQQVNYLIQVCKSRKYTSYTHAYCYNLEDRVWLKDNKLILTDINSGFYINVDNLNIEAYFIDIDQRDIHTEIKRLNTQLECIDLDFLRDTVLQVVNDKVEYVCPDNMQTLEFIIQEACLSMRSDKLGSYNIFLDLQSYEYQKNFFYTVYKGSEFEFLVQAFLTYGSGFEYDAERGLLYLPDVWHEELFVEPESSKNITREFIYFCEPRVISYLNSDWLEGLKYMLFILERDYPRIPFLDAYDQHTIEEVVYYYHVIVDRLESDIAIAY